MYLGYRSKSEPNAAIAKEVQCVLSKILGGPDYVRSGVFSQYHYYVGQYDTV